VLLSHLYSNLEYLYNTRRRIFSEEVQKHIGLLGFYDTHEVSS